jgi:hypothetical protein
MAKGAAWLNRKKIMHQQQTQKSALTSIGLLIEGVRFQNSSRVMKMLYMIDLTNV